MSAPSFMLKINDQRSDQSDLKGMTKITSAILILRKGKSAAWTADLDNQMIDWTRQYINWLETAATAMKESKAAK